MTWAKLKLGGAIAAAMLLTIGGAGAYAIRHEAEPPPAASAADAAAPASPVVAKLQNGTTVEVVALARRGEGKDRTFWNPDGSPTDARFDASSSEDDPPHTHELLLKIAGMETGDGSTWRFSNAPNWSAQPATHGGVGIGDDVHVVSFRPADGSVASDLKVTLASGAYQTVLAMRDMSDFQHAKTDAGEVIFSGAVDMNGFAAMAYTESFDNHQRRVLAFDHDGREHAPVGRGGERLAKLNLEIVHFDLPVEEIDRIEFQVRPFDQIVTIKDISLVPGKLTHPTVIVGAPATQPNR